MTTIEKVKTFFDEDEESEIYKIHMLAEIEDYGINYFVENLYVEATRFNDVVNDAVSTDFPECETLLKDCPRRAYWTYYAFSADSTTNKGNKISNIIPGMIHDEIMDLHACDEHRENILEEFVKGWES